MSKTFEQQLDGSEFASDAEFLASFGRMIAENPHRHPSDLLFIGEAIWRMQKKCVAGLEQMKRAAVMEERLRIMAIIAHGGKINQLPDAIGLALNSELSAADAMQIMTARDGSAPIKAN